MQVALIVFKLLPALEKLVSTALAAVKADSDEGKHVSKGEVTSITSALGEFGEALLGVIKPKV